MDSGNLEGFVSSHKEMFEQTTPPGNDQVRWQVMTSEDFALKKTCYQEVHNKMPMLPLEETLLMTARIL